MPAFNVNVPHPLSQEQATEQLKSLMEQVKNEHADKFDLESAVWTGPTFDFVMKTFGMKITGKMEVADNTVAISGDLPFAAGMFKGRIEQELKDRVSGALTNNSEPTA
jgi:hypothetical protein